MIPGFTHQQIWTGVVFASVYLTIVMPPGGPVWFALAACFFVGYVLTDD